MLSSHRLGALFAVTPTPHPTALYIRASSANHMEGIVVDSSRQSDAFNFIVVLAILRWHSIRLPLATSSTPLLLFRVRSLVTWDGTLERRRTYWCVQAASKPPLAQYAISAIEYEISFQLWWILLSAIHLPLLLANEQIYIFNLSWHH